MLPMAPRRCRWGDPSAPSLRHFSLNMLPSSMLVVVGFLLLLRMALLLIILLVLLLIIPHLLLLILIRLLLVLVFPLQKHGPLSLPSSEV